jgi:putative phage-type endonuclease
MKWVELDQQSPEWFAWREERYTASQASAVMEASAFWPRTPFQLYLLRTGQKEVVVTDAMRAGNRDEEKARAHIAWNVGEIVVPRCAETVLEGVPLGASLDAVHEGMAWEIKRPAKGSESDLWSASEAPATYLWQMVHTLLCAPIDQVMLAVYAHDLDQVKTVDTLFRDSPRYRELEEKLVASWVKFHGHLQALTPPPLSEGDEVLVDEADEEWKTAVDILRIAQEVAKNTAGALELAKARVIELAEVRGQGAKVRGGGFQVFRSTRAGTINWKAKPILAALKKAKVDPEEFRGAPTNYWTVKEG